MQYHRMGNNLTIILNCKREGGGRWGVCMHLLLIVQISCTVSRPADKHVHVLIINFILCRSLVLGLTS